MLPTYVHVINRNRLNSYHKCNLMILTVKCGQRTVGGLKKSH